ncbi:MAG: hypothetical protein WD118_00335 [Phycisphaeraceae bacterium]
MLLVAIRATIRLIARISSASCRVSADGDGAAGAAAGGAATATGGDGAAAAGIPEAVSVAEAADCWNSARAAA